MEKNIEADLSKAFVRVDDALRALSTKDAAGMKTLEPIFNEPIFRRFSPGVQKVKAKTKR